MGHCAALKEATATAPIFPWIEASGGDLGAMKTNMGVYTFGRFGGTPR